MNSTAFSLKNYLVLHRGQTTKWCSAPRGHQVQRPTAKFTNTPPEKLFHPNVGFHILGFHILGFHILGFRSLGFRSLGFRSLGFHSLGCHSLGFHSLGFHSLGFHSLGFQSLGFQSLGFQSLGFQSLGFQSLGFQSLGFQSLGFQSLGFQSLTSPNDNAHHPGEEEKHFIIYLCMDPVEGALHIRTWMCEYGVLKQTHIEVVESWKYRPIMNGPYSYNTHHE